MQFSLITYNIWSGKHWKEVIDFLREKNADVICLQEVSVYNQYHTEARDIDVVAELEKAFTDYNLIYAPISKRKRENKEESFGNVILSRFPILSSEINYLLRPLQWTDKHEEQSRNILEVELLIGGKVFKVMTGHLTYAPGFNDTEDQINEAKKITEIIGDKSPLVLAGDLNSHSDTQVVQILKQKLPANDQLNNPTFARQPFSYNGFTVNKLEYKIDYILGTEDIKITDAQVIDVPYSDHLPIMADIYF